MKPEIIDNFLDLEEFYKIQSVMINPDDNVSIPWFFKYGYYSTGTGKLDNDLDKFCFTHTFYTDNAVKSSYIDKLNPILDILNPIAIVRIIANLLGHVPNIIENPFHSDLEELSEEKQKQWLTSIFYVNTNNGYTKFEDGTKVESVGNRLLTFPANMKHMGTSCTDQQFRIVINFNYYSKYST